MFCQKFDFLIYYHDISLILACNIISIIHFNGLQSQLSFEVLCFKIDHVVMKLSTKT